MIPVLGPAEHGRRPFGVEARRPDRVEGGRIDERTGPGSASRSLQGQIEHAVRDATGEALSWPALARTAGGALPVVLLDGFDELLQATGVSRSDYLEQVVRFAEREADHGRPVAVVVTSRTTVADRTRIPPGGTVAVRLEPFDDAQVGRWLDIWNHANAPYFAAAGLRALPVQTVLVHQELTGRPLLLLMLALYDADDNTLQREGAALDRAGLYEASWSGSPSAR